jgi:hypothetical protein
MQTFVCRKCRKQEGADRTLKWVLMVEPNAASASPRNVPAELFQ